MKKLLVIIGVLLLCTVLTVGAFLLALRSARVQTAAVAILTDELSRSLKADIHIDHVDIRPPLALYMQGVYCSDQQGDTLLYVPQLRVRFNPFALEQQRLSFPLVEVKEPYFHIKQDSLSSNFDFLVRAFQSKQPHDSLSYGIECRRIALSNARIHYEHYPSGTDLWVSDIQTDLGFRYEGQNAMAATLRALHLKAQVPAIDGYVEADLHGTPDTLYADHVLVNYRNQQILSGDIRIDQPLIPDSLYAHIACTDLYANADLITALVSDLTHRPFTLPDMVYQLGNIHYRGTVDGHLNDLRLHGGFVTRLGTITTDARVQDLTTLQGDITTRNWAMDRMLHNTDMGRLSASLHVDASLTDSLPEGTLRGRIERLDYKGYAYSDITLSAQARKGLYTASLQADGQDLAFDLNGSADLQTDLPTISATMHMPRCDLAHLHLTDSALGHWLAINEATMQMTMDQADGMSIDGMEGEVVIQSLLVRGAGQQLMVPQVTVALSREDSLRHLALRSAIVNADVDGAFSFATLPATLRTFLHHSLPSLVAAPTTVHQPNDLTFHVDIVQPNQLLDIIMPNRIDLPQQPDIHGFIHEADSTYDLHLSIPEIKQGNVAYQNIAFTIHNNNEQHDLGALFSIRQHLISLDSTRLRVNDLILATRLDAHEDTLTTTLSFMEEGKQDSVSTIAFATLFDQEQQRPRVTVHILPSDFQIGRQFWHSDAGQITYVAADTAIRVENVHFYTKDQLLHIQGTMSPRVQDSLRVQLKDMDLGYLLSATQVLDAVDIRGRMTGWATLYSAFSTPQFEANITMPEGIINGTNLGCVTAGATLDRASGDMLISGNAVLDSVQIATITGRVVPSKPAYWEIFINANGAPVSFINRWTEGIIDDINGKAFGQVHVFGTNMHTWVTAKAFAQDASLVIPYTGGRYFFSDSVILDTTYISFPHVRLRDAEGHQGLVSGLITHNCFGDIRYNIQLDCQDLLALDLKADPQRMYYGRAYATGHVDIYGDPQQTHIDVNATTAGNTDFYFSLATAEDASESDFITFRQPYTGDSTTYQMPDTTIRPNSHIWLNLAIEAIPSSRVHMVLDDRNGDGIVGRGEGSLRLLMDASTGDVQLLGDYTLMDGTFSYSLGNIVHRDFAIQEGSSVSWSGDATMPQLNITAKYRCTASLRDLFGADVKSVTSRSSIPVDCVIHLTGDMDNPIMKFDIDFPQSDESVSAQIYAIINTEAMLMRQVVYLLIFNRFYAPDYMRSTNSNAGLNDAYSLLSSTVTGQINAWLSKLTSMVNVGFNMRSDGEAGNQSYETEANIQIQPINRLTINGNVGYRYNDISNQPIFGDADVEYELTADGKLRAKVFTHSVDKYSLHQSGMQEGIGFLFRHDFNSGDAKKKREQKKEKSK
ncbi:MAG: translocation/assembly module TamB [Paludibacteraceae bacterium]|nr:translocation/assembly module TamB [Paludibacteraceae bacterium]